MWISTGTINISLLGANAANHPPSPPPRDRREAVWVGEIWSGGPGAPKVVLTPDVNLVPHVNFLYNTIRRTLMRFHTADIRLRNRRT